MDAYSATLILTAVASAFAGFRLVVSGSWRNFPFLLFFFVFQVFQNAGAALAGRPSLSLYVLVYESEPLNWILFIFIFWEVYRRVFKNYPGIASTAQIASWVSAGLAVAVGVVLYTVAPKAEISHAAVRGYLVYWERGLFFMLAVFILGMVILLSRYNLEIESSLAWNIGIFSVYLFGWFFLLSLAFPGAAPWRFQFRNYGLLVVSISCFIAWGVALRKRSGISVVKVRPKMDPFDEERLLGQLTMLNNMLMKSAQQ